MKHLYKNLRGLFALCLLGGMICLCASCGKSPEALADRTFDAIEDLRDLEEDLRDLSPKEQKKCLKYITSKMPEMEGEVEEALKEFAEMDF